MLNYFISNNQNVFENGVDMEALYSAIYITFENSCDSIWATLNVNLPYSEFEMEYLEGLDLGMDSTISDSMLNIYASDLQILYLDDIQKVIFDTLVKDSADIFNEIASIEYAIVTDNGLNDQEIAELLISASVTKYSYVYWDKESKLGEQSQWATIFSRNKSNNPNGYQHAVANIVDADYSGAAVGAIYGGYVGAVSGTAAMPGVGSITGAIVGGVTGASTGAVAGSVCQGVWEVGKWVRSWF